LSRREAFLSAAIALWGLAIAIALVPFWSGPPYDGQTASYATKIGLDARAPMRVIFSLILLTAGLPALLGPLTRRLAASRSWAMNLTAAACVLALWTSLISPSLGWTVIPTGAAIAAATMLRHHDAQFTRHDLILLPSIMTVFIGLADITSLPVDRVAIISIAAVMAVRLLLVWIPSAALPAFAFALAPLAILLQTGFVPGRVRYAGWPAVAIAIVTPFVLRRFVRESRWLALAIAFVIYPLFTYAYTNATSMITTEGKPRVSVFEDTHHLLPASEMIRGEILYRDIVPGHGLIEDGLLSYVALRGDVTTGAALRRRAAVTALNGTALYAAGAAATGPASAGVAAFFLATLLGITPMTARTLPALAGLAFLTYAVRRRKPLAFVAAAACAVVAFFTSLDYGAFTAITIVIMALRARPVKPALIATLAGAGAMTLLFLIPLAIAGIVDDFLRVTVVELVSSTHTGTLTVFGPSAWLRSTRTFPELLAGVFDRLTYPVFCWVGSLIITAVFLPRRAGRRYEPMLALALWIVIASVSYAQRHHMYFIYALPVLLVVVAWLLLRRRSPYGVLAVVLLVILAQPTAHLAIAGWLRRTRAPLDAERWVEIHDPPRARGALFAREDAAMIGSVRRYVDTRLAPHETFFDFTDRGLLYFLLRRDCPVRQPAVIFFQGEALQREVIARLEANKNVKAALIGYGGIDGVPNQHRAPLVWKYLQDNFEPDFQEGDVIFWRRR
jgi:hypothetical protein